MLARTGLLRIHNPFHRNTANTLRERSCKFLTLKFNFAYPVVSLTGTTLYATIIKFHLLLHLQSLVAEIALVDTNIEFTPDVFGFGVLVEFEA